jgi:hypothetical protein
LKVIGLPPFNLELLTFQLRELAIAPLHPIGYNGGRSDGSAVLLRGS